MKKKVTKIFSALTAIVLTVLSVMMVTPVEAKAEDPVPPMLRLESTGGWSQWDSTAHEYVSVTGSRGSFNANLSSSSNEVIGVARGSGSECPIVHFPDGSKDVFTADTTAAHYPAVFFTESPITWNGLGADLYLWNIPTVECGATGDWNRESGWTIVYSRLNATWIKLLNTSSNEGIYVYANGEAVSYMSPYTTKDSPVSITTTDIRSWFPLQDDVTAKLSWETDGDAIYFTATVINDPQPSLGESSGKSNAHVHNFQWQTITEPTKDADGLEGEVCSCGAIRNTQPISAFAYALYQYAIPMINAAKPGQTITFEFGEFNSFPKAFMEKLVEKNGQNVTFVFHYKWNHVKQKITIPAGNPIDLNFDWYGPAKMAELYGAN